MESVEGQERVDLGRSNGRGEYDWLIKRKAVRFRREGKGVRIGYMKLWVDMDGKIRIWDEAKDRLKKYKEEI